MKVKDKNRVKDKEQSGKCEQKEMKQNIGSENDDEKQKKVKVVMREQRR